MKAPVMQRVEIEIATVDIKVPVRYGDEDMPYDFPKRSGDVWAITVDIDTGTIRNWPNYVANVHMKVCDEGEYTLRDASGKEVAKKEFDYVPHGLIPGKYGDYIIMNIDACGVITNWPKRPNVDEFFPTD